jgi:putative flippase GtrA
VQGLRSLVLFGVSGVMALGVDVGVLYLTQPWLGFYVGRLLSFVAAATFTWLFNRSITFKGPRQGGIVAEYLAYLSSMAVGGLINYGVYVGSLQCFDAVRAEPAWGVALGSLVSMGFNFLAARRVIQG